MRLKILTRCVLEKLMKLGRAEFLPLKGRHSGSGTWRRRRPADLEWCVTVNIDGDNVKRPVQSSRRYAVGQTERPAYWPAPLIRGKAADGIRITPFVSPACSPHTSVSLRVGERTVWRACCARCYSGDAGHGAARKYRNQWRTRRSAHDDDDDDSTTTTETTKRDSRPSSPCKDVSRWAASCLEVREYQLLEDVVIIQSPAYNTTHRQTNHGHDTGVSRPGSLLDRGAWSFIYLLTL